MAESEFGFGFKVVVVGNSGVGKTSAMQRFLYGKFPDTHIKSLVSQFHEKSFDLKETAETIDLMIWDTPGRECLHLLAEDAYVNANIAVIFYSAVDKASFDAIPTWVDAVKKVTGPIQFVLVENKVDLTDKYAIDPAEAQTMSKRFDAPLFRISVKENLNLKALFTHLASILQSKYMTSLNQLPRGGDAFFVNEFEELDLGGDEDSMQAKPEDNQGACRVA
ncbi:Ras family protein [Trichomonas vaginalis G3]|uniref:Ras family protein n=1 Tax=Trichomonas vaginalis (strain ATCC PRA-98 / G3) TaxID=412133 RepID=A2G211_TRIV3|nr:craniofacial suture morphogenesis protein family [Trichomonas vaginalis G3]EAX88803.1 Ras family protein [Trichomonas vaginalis G3]KAI5521864.1 craniofacial suture morphogenesis protein family [Trichomonas vaginalis G3]|eukprot:XP_001301733.1 Ras family protein [Trichomonas vaginalis G3]